MEEAYFQYDVDAELQPYNCSCPPIHTGGALRLQEESCCNYAYASSTSSTPFVSAPSSPRKSTPFATCSDSARSTPAASSDQWARDVVEYDAFSGAYAEADHMSATTASSPSLSDFEFSSRLSEADAWFNPSSLSPPMSTAEELFYNGKIRPLNTILCSSASHGICCFGCFSDAVFDNQLYGYQDPAHSFKAYTEHILPPSQHAEHHQQQHPLMRKQRSSRHAKPTSTPSALEQWKKSMGMYEKGHARQYAHGQHVEKIMQISSLPLAHYGRNSRRDRSHHRRARSLSPMRVFHIDEKMMQARASFESDMHTTKKVSHTAAVDGAATILTRPRRTRKSWTLKELLNMGDNRAHNKIRCPPELRVNGAESVNCGSASSAFKCRMEEIEANLVKNAKDNVGKRSLEEKRWHRKSGTHSEGARSPWKLQQAEQKQYADQQYPCTSGSEEGHVEEMGKWNFLHHKKGWLGCLGFTDNSTEHNSIKGLQSCIT